MTKLKAGDRVSCKLKESCIVNPYNDYDDIRSFEIIAKDSEGYHLFVPPYIFIKGAYRIDNYNYKKFDIKEKYIGDDAIYIEEKLIHQVVFVLEGASCNRCCEFFDYAAPEDKNTWLCYCCSANPYR